MRNDLYKPDKKSYVYPYKKPYTYQEFNYIERYDEDDLMHLRGMNVVGIDPGKSDLIFCTDGKVETVKKGNKTYRKANTFTYSNKQRKMEIKTNLYRNKRNQLKKKTKIYRKTVEEWEAILSTYNSKSCQLDNVKKWIRIKNQVNNHLYKYYENKMFRKFDLYAYMDKQRSEANMMNRFEQKFGSPENTLVLIGDYSENRPKKYQEPTKGKSIRKLFKNRGYKLYLVNEFRTSIRLYNTGEKLEYIRWDNKRNRQVHRLLGSKIYKSGKMDETNELISDLMRDTSYRPTIINRDLNGSLNIRLKGLMKIMGCDKPYYLERTYDVPIKEKKVINVELTLDLPKIITKPIKRTKATKATKVIRTIKRTRVTKAKKP